MCLAACVVQLEETFALLVTNLFSVVGNAPALLDGDAVGRLLRAMDECLDSVKVHAAVCVAVNVIADVPLGRTRILASQGLLRVFRSMDLHPNVRTCD